MNETVVRRESYRHSSGLLVQATQIGNVITLAYVYSDRELQESLCAMSFDMITAGMIGIGWIKE